MLASQDQPRPAQSTAWPLPVRVARRPRAHPWQRARCGTLARWRAGTLDHRLAAGASPRSDAVIAYRALQLTSPRSRRRLADGLTRALSGADRDWHGFTAAVAPDRSEVLAARPVIETLARRLRDPAPVRARGVAMLQVLLTEGASPLYRTAAPGALGSYLRGAAAVLDEPKD